MCAIPIVAVLAWFGGAIVAVPTTEIALQKSLRQIHRPELSIAVALHPEYCVVEGRAGLGWSVVCRGVPLHHYVDATICLPVTPERCAPASPIWTNCREFMWNIDAWGRPSDPVGPDRNYASIEDDCRPLVTLAEDRAEMERRGLQPVKQKIFNFTGGAMDE